MIRSKNFLILISILLLGGVFALIATYYFDVDPNYLQACTEEAKVCPDGSTVVRTGANCDFEDCSIAVQGTDGSPELKEPLTPTSSVDSVACTQDVKGCPDGTFVGRIAPDCEFAACPTHQVPDDDFMACSHEVKICPDGSEVSPRGPNCEFSPCPDETMKESIDCDPESRRVDGCIEIYQPVCGLVEVQCVTTPCNPVPETFSNSCYACKNENVISYTGGSCDSYEQHER